MSGVIKIFFRSVSKKYFYFILNAVKKLNIVKYYYNLKELKK